MNEQTTSEDVLEIQKILDSQHVIAKLKASKSVVGVSKSVVGVSKSVVGVSKSVAKASWPKSLTRKNKLLRTCCV